MQIKIKDLAIILTGYNFRSALENNSGGDIYVLQAKNVKSEEYINSVNGFAKQYSDIFRNPPKVKYNDVIIVSRGNGLGSFRSTVFKEAAGNIIASSSVLIIRVKSDIILPEYLTIYLNSDDGQGRLFQIASGASFKALSPGNLADLEMPVPSLSLQQKIVDLNENIIQQQNIMQNAIEIKKNILNGIFNLYSN